MAVPARRSTATATPLSRQTAPCAEAEAESRGSRGAARFRIGDLDEDRPRPADALRKRPRSGQCRSRGMADSPRNGPLPRSRAASRTRYSIPGSGGSALQLLVVPVGRAGRYRVLPHDQRVLAVVRVVAAPDAARPEPGTLVEPDRVLVRDAHL